jgi:hypothetical protein
MTVEITAGDEAIDHALAQLSQSFSAGGQHLIHPGRDQVGGGAAA